MPKFQRPRGTRDLFKGEWIRTSLVCRVIQDIVSSYGYEGIKTPMFEYRDIFEEEGNPINKQLFYFGEEEKYVLRPENTASVARAVVENGLLYSFKLPLRFFYCGSFFRHERPQKGRFREFTQFGIEKVGAKSFSNDLENIVLVDSILKEFGVSHLLTLKINYLPDPEGKREWGEALTEHFRKHKDQLSPISQERIEKNPWRILDDKEDGVKDFVLNAPSIHGFIDGIKDNQFKCLDDVVSHLKNSLKINVVKDLNLVRGFDYYSGLVYEWEYNGLAVISGGRYDFLFSKFTDRSDLHSLGLAIGIERLVDLLNESNPEIWKKLKEKYPKPRLVYFISDIFPPKEFLDVLAFLRSNGVAMETSWDIGVENRHIDHAKFREAIYVATFDLQQRKISFKSVDSSKEKSFFVVQKEEMLKFVMDR